MVSVGAVMEEVELSGAVVLVKGAAISGRCGGGFKNVDMSILLANFLLIHQK